MIKKVNKTRKSKKMCFICHKAFADEIIKKQLVDALNKQNFEGWNSTSLNHVIIAAIGYNGKEASIISKEILVKYMKWVQDKPNEFYEKKLIYCTYDKKPIFSSMLTYNHVEEILKNIEKSIYNSMNADEIKKNLTEKDIKNLY